MLQPLILRQAVLDAGNHVVQPKHFSGVVQQRFKANLWASIAAHPLGYDVFHQQRVLGQRHRHAGCSVEPVNQRAVVGKVFNENVIHPQIQRPDLTPAECDHVAAVSGLLAVD